MENNRDAQFDFCPKCGALARDGVCTSCGYQNAQMTSQKTDSDAVATTPVESKAGDSTSVGDSTSMENNTSVEADTSVKSTANSQDGARENSYLYTEQNPYAEYANRTAYVNGAIPPDIPEKKGNGKVWAIVIACVAVFVLLLVLLGCSVYSLASKIQNLSKKENSKRPGQEYEYKYSDKDFDEAFDDDNEKEYDDYDFNDFYNDITERAKENQNAPEDNDDSADMYYELDNMLRDDLPYSITFKEQKYEEEERDVNISCSYPVLEGKIENIDFLNQVIYSEYKYFLYYYEENIRDYMSEDEMFHFIMQGYVTYMDEEKISIVFTEDTYYNNYYLAYLYCINIDVENGVVLDNTAILDIDDEFSVDFRIREEKQNESDSLEWYTDQELTEMMNDPRDLIIFYTPLGMEVGVNHDGGWNTVSYKDYEEYLKQF